jgi:calcium permeable stress-gated cation channel
VSSILSTLLPVLVVTIVGFSAFLILRPRVRRIYEPRSFLSTLRPEERSPPLPKSMFGFIPFLFKVPDTYVLNHQSMDAYFLLRFLRISVIICLVGVAITWPVLFAVDATANGPATQLQILTLSNVPGYNNPRLYAHLFCAWAFFGFVWFLIARFVCE